MMTFTKVGNRYESSAKVWNNITLKHEAKYVIVNTTEGWYVAVRNQTNNGYTENTTFKTLKEAKKFCERNYDAIPYFTDMDRAMQKALR